MTPEETANEVARTNAVQPVEPQTTPALTEEQQKAGYANPAPLTPEEQALKDKAMGLVKEVVKKVFNRNDIKRTIDLQIVFPKIYPDYEPWGFKFRLKLSREAEETRQQYLSLAAAEQTAKITDQALDEVCDLMAELPTGFSDLVDLGKGAGHSFRSYVTTATDPDMKDFLAMVVEAADSAYWGAITPREFRKPL